MTCMTNTNNIKFWRHTRYLRSTTYLFIYFKFQVRWYKGMFSLYKLCKDDTQGGVGWGTGTFRGAVLHGRFFASIPKHGSHFELKNSWIPFLYSGHTDAKFAQNVIIMANFWDKISIMGRGGSLLFLALASGTGNLRKLPVRKRIYLPHFF